MVLCLPAKPESPAFFDSPDIAGLIVVMHVVEECADFYLLLEIVTGGVPLAEILALGAEYSDRQLLVACRTAFVHWNRGSSEVVSSRSRTPLDARLVEPSLREVVRDTGEPRQVDDLYELGSVEGVARDAGFATLVVEPLKADDLAVVLDRADAALYRAKSAGKGQVHLAA